MLKQLPLYLPKTQNAFKKGFHFLSCAVKKKSFKQCLKRASIKEENKTGGGGEKTISKTNTINDYHFVKHKTKVQNNNGFK